MLTDVSKIITSLPSELNSLFAVSINIRSHNGALLNSFVYLKLFLRFHFAHNFSVCVDVEGLTCNWLSLDFFLITNQTHYLSK